MDFFSSLAPELRHEILLHLKTRSNIAPLLRASPTMLAQYIESEELIQRAFLRAEFDGSVLQDALGVVLFPPLLTTKVDKNEVRRHVRRWALAQLPDPFQHQDHATVECLGRLYDRLSLYMDDYITKATSIFPPRTYLGLPDLSKRGQLQFRNKPIGPKVLKMDTLSDPERRRLLQAFLRFEMLSKIWHMNQGMKAPLPLENFFDDVFGGDKLRAWEREAIRCVHEYVTSLYGAAYAHLADSWLPDVPHTLATEMDERAVDSGLEFPDSVWFGADEYYKDAKIQACPPISAEWLALCGFDLATALLMLPRDERGCPRRLVQWLKAALRWYHRTSSLYEIDVLYLLNHSALPDCKHWEECPGMYRALRVKILGSYDDTEYPDDGVINTGKASSAEIRLQLRVYRQRAWVFFDDARHYPRQDISLHFPTYEQLQQMGPPSDSRALRRSQKCQDERLGSYIPSLDRAGSEEDGEIDLGHEDEELPVWFFSQALEF